MSRASPPPATPTRVRPTRARPTRVRPTPSAADTVLPHPVYGRLGWLAVVSPGARTEAAVRDLLRTAHDLARSRDQRRGEFRAGR